MRAFNKLVSRYSSIFYVQIWEKKLKITEAPSGRVIEEPPLVAIRTEKDGKKVIDSVGYGAKLATGANVIVVNPFSHPRVLFSDFTVGEKLLAYFFKQMNEGRYFALRPVVVVHPMEKTEGGLTGIERKAFQELGAGAGAREVFVHEGAEIPLQNLQQEKLEAKEDVPSLRQTKGGPVGTVVSYVLFLLAILFAFFLMKLNGN